MSFGLLLSEEHFISAQDMCPDSLHMAPSSVLAHGNGRSLNIRTIYSYPSSVTHPGPVLVGERIKWVTPKVCDYFVIVEIIETAGPLPPAAVPPGELCSLMFFVDEEGGMNVRE